MAKGDPNFEKEKTPEVQESTRKKFKELVQSLLGNSEINEFSGVKETLIGVGRNLSLSVEHWVEKPFSWEEDGRNWKDTDRSMSVEIKKIENIASSKSGKSCQKVVLALCEMLRNGDFRSYRYNAEVASDSDESDMYMKWIRFLKKFIDHKGAGDEMGISSMTDEELQDFVSQAEEIAKKYLKE
jgi:hypothetical protein